MKPVKFLFALTIILTVFVGCKSDDEKTTEFDSVGRILGLDEALCACCGNWVIEIDSEQNWRQFVELPENSGIDLNTETFPLSVRFNWDESNLDCQFIIISDIVID